MSQHYQIGITTSAMRPLHMQVKENAPGLLPDANVHSAVVGQQAGAALKPSVPVVDLTDASEPASKRQRV